MTILGNLGAADLEDIAIGKVICQVDLDRSAPLKFEISDGKRPMQRHRGALPRIEGGYFRFAVSPRRASCKPRDRRPQEQTAGPACSTPSAARPS